MTSDFVFSAPEAFTSPYAGASVAERETARHSSDIWELRNLAAGTYDTEIFDFLMDNPALSYEGWKAIVDRDVHVNVVIQHPDVPQRILLDLVTSKEFPKVSRAQNIFRHQNFSAYLFNEFWDEPSLDVTSKLIRSWAGSSPYLTEHHLNDYARNFTGEDIIYLGYPFLRDSKVTVETVELMLKNPHLHPQSRMKSIRYIHSKQYPQYPLEWVEALYPTPSKEKN